MLIGPYLWSIPSEPPLAGRMVAGGVRGGVSNKIQQLLNTLKVSPTPMLYGTYVHAHTVYT